MTVLDEVNQKNPWDADEGVSRHSRSYLSLVDGKPLTQIPQDLYIPPDALEVFLEAFEGPWICCCKFDSATNMDILRIDVSAITHQYMH